MTYTLKDLAERLTNCEREHELQMGSRRLGQSSIGGGGLRIYDEGNLTIDQGGDLTIVDGDLVLSEGIIDGSALETQIAADSKSTSATKFSVNKSWSNKASVKFTPPEWAAQVIIVARIAGLANNSSGDKTYNIYSRFDMAGSNTPQAASRAFIYKLMRPAATFTNAWAAIRPAAEEMEVSAQIKSDASTDETTDNRIGLQATFFAMS